MKHARMLSALAGLALSVGLAGARDLPSFDKVSEGFEAVNSSADGSKPLYNVWINKKDRQLLAEIPRSAMNKRFFIIPTVAGGDRQMGVYSDYHSQVGKPSKQLYWKKIGDELVLIEPNLSYRSMGDAESKAATSRIYTDRVVTTVPIIAKGPSGGHVIDLDALMLGKSSTFFGGFTRGANTKLAEIKSAKAFPHNLEFTLELPRSNGQVVQIHYSIGSPPKSTGFKPREADRRVGFFYTDFTDRAKNDGESQKVRYAHRWNLEKRDPKLKLSPPKQPIVYYIEHTTPVRYRKWVRDGILAWNEAFEQVGILGAIEVRQQDAQTGVFMDIDPEDIRYSFVRWTNSHMGFAIGPSHAHPETGEIYEADIVMDEQFISGWARSHITSQLATEAMLDMDAETVAWFDLNPDWDPRVRLAAPQDRAQVAAYRKAVSEGQEWEGEIPPTMLPTVWSATDAEIATRGGICNALHHLTRQVGYSRMMLDAGILRFGDEDDDENGDEDGDENGEDDVQMLDGLPEDFVGPLLRAVIMHEVGHTMGLMHNWKGTSTTPYAEANSEEFKGKKSISVSVMDYLPINIVATDEDSELIQGDFDTIGLGTYDMWAIEWGYTPKGSDKIARQAADPAHAFTSDEGSSGPDPHAKTWDIGENSLDFADNQIRLAHRIRSKIIDEIVEDNQSWQKASRAYQQTLGLQMGAMRTASNWIGGAHINRFRKGDEGASDPIRPVDVERQRRAVELICANAFDESAFGLSPELLAKFGADQWFDERGSQPDWPVHDQVLGVQASAMSMLLNPTRLRRVLDNEQRTASGEDALTVPEILEHVRESVWISDDSRQNYSVREPMVSSIARNLQREHLDRLIDLATGLRWPGASGATISSLARQELREIQGTVEAMQKRSPDSYTSAHLADAGERIAKALDAGYIRRD